MNKKTILAAFLLTLGASAFCYAADADDVQSASSTLPTPRAVATYEELKPHVGLVAGSATPEGHYDTGTEYGIEVGYQPYIPFGVGLQLTRMDADSSRSGGEDLERTAALFRGTYNFGGTTPFLRSTYLGLEAGLIFKSGSTSLASAPVVGFDIPLQPEAHRFVSLGANARYLIVEGGEPDAFSVNGAVKYWY